MSRVTLQSSVLFNPLLALPSSEVKFNDVRQLTAGDDRPDERGVAPPDQATALERSAVRFASPRKTENARTAARVERILREKTMFVTSEGVTLDRLSHERDAVRHYVEGNIHLPRLEALHRLLCGEKGTGDATAIEVSSASIPLVSVALASMGTRVTFTNDERTLVNIHRMFCSMYVPEYLCRRISYQRGHLHSVTGLDVDVTYFADPLYSLYDDSEGGLRVLDKMGSELRPGGYLVIQSTLPVFRHIPFDSTRWEQVCSFMMAYGSDLDGLVLPTMISNIDSALGIYRRLG